MATVPSPLPEMGYPTSDGKPVAEGEIHLLAMFDLIDGLLAWYADQPRVWVGGNQLLCHVEGDPRKRTSFDVMVTHGISKEPPRDNYLVWKESKAPNVVIELTLRSTQWKDVKTKFELYRDVLRIKEYFLFDPRKEYLKPPLQGYRLVKGKYVPIGVRDGRLPSKLLGLHLEEVGPWLRLYDPAQRTWLLTAAEVRAELARLRRELKAERWRANKSGKRPT